MGYVRKTAGIAMTVIAFALVPAMMPVAANARSAKYAHPAAPPPPPSIGYYGEFPVELGRDIDHEGRLHRVFAVGEGIQDLVGPVGLSGSLVLFQAGEEAGVTPQL